MAAVTGYTLSEISEAVTAFFTATMAIVVVIQLPMLREQLKGLKKELRQAKGALAAETYRHLEDKFYHSKTMIEARQNAAIYLLDLMKKTDEEKAKAVSDANPAFIEVANFFDYVGTLERLGVIDKEFVYSSFYRKCFAFWQAGIEIVKFRREQYQEESRLVWTDFEELTKLMREIHLQTLRVVKEHEAYDAKLPNDEDWKRTLYVETQVGLAAIAPKLPSQ